MKEVLIRDAVNIGVARGNDRKNSRERGWQVEKCCRTKSGNKTSNYHRRIWGEADARA